jgi:hypothetical protein
VGAVGLDGVLRGGAVAARLDRRGWRGCGGVGPGVAVEHGLTTYSMRERIGRPSREDGANLAAFDRVDVAARTNASDASRGTREISTTDSTSPVASTTTCRATCVSTGGTFRGKRRDDGRERLGLHDLGCRPFATSRTAMRASDQAPVSRCARAGSKHEGRTRHAFTSGSTGRRSARRPCCRPARST